MRIRLRPFRIDSSGLRLGCAHILACNVAFFAMAPFRRFAFVASATLTGAAAVGLSRSSPEVKPRLDPESHHTFFKKDYPHDDHPEPSPGAATLPIQEDEVYDADYVKDENNEGEAWQHEYEYEQLKARLARARAAAKEAEKAEASAKGTVDGEKEEDDSLKKAMSDKAAKAEEKKRAALEAARAKVKAAQERYGRAMAKTPGGSAVADAEKALAAQKKKCEEIAKSLEAAKAKLEAARAKWAAAEKQHAAALAVAFRAEEQALEAERSAVQLEEAKKKERDSAASALEKETHEYNKAHALHERNVLALHTMEADLADAVAKLRAFRKMGA